MNLQHALQARKRSYAPYSHFYVGAALQTAQGHIFTGCNIENKSFSVTNCAERSAIFSAISQGCTQFTELVIAGGRTDEEAATVPCKPCGACLQVLSEFCDKDFPILLADGMHTLGEFLPNAFEM